MANQQTSMNQLKDLMNASNTNRPADKLPGRRPAGVFVDSLNNMRNLGKDGVIHHGGATGQQPNKAVQWEEPSTTG